LTGASSPRAGIGPARVEPWSAKGRLSASIDAAIDSRAIDARAKLIALLVLLVAIATTSERRPWIYAGYFVLLLVAIFLARLPLRAIFARAALVLPFSAAFALMAWWMGEPAVALLLIVKSFLSILAALTLAASTPWTRLLDALVFLRVPAPLLLVIQFIGRYLFLVTGEAAQMRLAAQCRRGTRAWDSTRDFHAAAGAVGVLFARSWERADGIYQAMLARGFAGRFPPPASAPFRTRDAAFMSLSVAATLAVRLAL
jgi:cobalt/nickel transport system permease protein